MIFEILAVAALLGVIGCFSAFVVYKRETEIELNAKNTRLAALALSIEAQHENAEVIQKEINERFIRLEAAMETAAENERKFQDGLNNLLNYDITTAFGGGNG